MRRVEQQCFRAFFFMVISFTPKDLAKRTEIFCPLIKPTDSYAAWQTGITLENVALRQDAFDHFNLPFRLRHGRIGRLTAQIPWKSLSSPLLVELEDVELWVEVVDDREDVPLETVMQRLWKRKKTLIASEELEDLAKETGSQTKGGSFFFSFLRRAAAVFLKRLQFTVRSVHVSVVDDSPTVYRRFGFTLESFGTQPGAGGSPENGMQDVHKSAALEGLQLYWTNHSHSKSESPTPIDVKQGDYLLRRPLNVDIDIRLVLEQRKGRMLSMWANVSLGFLDIALQDWQIVDMYKFSDALQWKTVRSKYLDVLQTSTCSTGPSRNWRSLWQFAINAVLLDLHGPLKAAPWRPRLQKQLDCLRYTAIYRNKLRGEDVSLSSVTAYDEKLTELERLLSIADIVQSRRLARQSVGQSRKVSGTPESGKSNAAIQEGRGGLIQGLAKAARVLGFSTSWVTGQSSEVRVAAPTESEVQELYSSVNAAYSTYEEDGDDGNGNEQGDQQEKGMDWTSGQLAAEDYAEDDGVDNGGINLDFGAKKASLTLLDGFKSTVARINAFDVQIEAKFVGNAERVVELMIDQVEGLDATSMPFIKCGSLLTELPAIRLQHAVVGWPVVLDILVQPVTAKMSLPLIQKLSAWMPPPMERSYDVVRMESINSLSLVAKLNIKSGILKDRAHQVRPIDLVAKIMSSEVRLVEDRFNNEDGSYISLSIDEVIVHSVGLEESAQTMIKVESIVRHQEGQEGHQDQLAAMEAIEQELFYDHFHFKALNVAVYCCDMRSKNSHHVEVMSPVRLSGLIKVHAVPEDHSSSQMDISLDVGCVDVGLNDAFWEIMGNVQAFQQTNDVGIVINNCQDDNFMQQHSKLVKTLTLNVQLSSIEIKEMLTPTGTNACFTDQVRATGATVAVSIYAKGKPSVDADLKDLEILQHLDHKVADGDGDGDGDGDELLMKEVYYGKRRLLGMLPPFVKKITVAQARYTNYLHDFSRDRTEVCLSDILLEGDTLHQGCFLGR